VSIVSVLRDGFNQQSSPFSLGVKKKTFMSGIDLCTVSCQHRPSMAKKTTATKTPRKPNAALMKPVQPDAILAAVVGSEPASRGELTKKLWDYIKKNGLQDAAKKTNINADAALKAVFGGKAQVTMFEMTKLVSAHIK
jgi:chromatin remodeling complex protein RSC6